MTKDQLWITVIISLCIIQMKNSFSWLIVLGMAVSFISCNKDIIDNKDSAIPGTLSITVTAQAPSLNTEVDTRSYIGTHAGTSNTILWGEDESLKIGVLGDGDVSKDTWANKTTSEYKDQPTATFSFSVTPQAGKTGESYTYVGIYPASASLDESSVTAHKVTLKKEQNSTPDSYDPEAYILVAKPDAGHNASNSNWNASFRRAIALNKVTLKNIHEAIESVQIIVPDGKYLTGNRYMDLSTGNSGKIYNGDNSVTVNYAVPNAGVVVEGVNCKTVWFTSWGIEVAEGESLTIIARTPTRFYTRTIQARAEGIQFKEGFLNTLGVNMATATVTYKSYTYSFQSKSVVYDNANHSAFASIHDFESKEMLAFREGTAHRPASSSEYGVVRVLENASSGWTLGATISDPTKDLRDPFLVEVDGHPRLYMGYNTFENEVYQHSGTAYSDFINGNWTPVQILSHDLNHVAWLWKVRQYRDKYYSVAYLEGERPALMVSADGVNWTTLTVFALDGILTEADMCFVGETMYICLRKDTPISDPSYWGVAQYPFTDFTWSEMERHIESPEMLWMPYSNEILLAGREQLDGSVVNVTLFSASFDGKLEVITILETAVGGDKGYPGLMYKDGKLYCTYYNGSKELSSIYLASWIVEE